MTVAVREAGALDHLLRSDELQSARESGKPYPLVVMITTDPWLAVVGSDSPAFALYSDGQTIYRDGEGFKSTRLNETELAVIIDDLDPARLSELSGWYTTIFASDQPRTFLFFLGPDNPFVIGIYGKIDSVHGVHTQLRLPEPLESAVKTLRGFSDPNATPWLPDKLEVMVWPYENAPAPSVVWPEGLPGLTDQTTVKRERGSYSIYVPQSKLRDLNDVLPARRPKGAIEIDGKKWSASVRLPFPDEALWMGPPPPR